MCATPWTPSVLAASTSCTVDLSMVMCAWHALTLSRTSDSMPSLTVSESLPSLT